MVGTPDSVSRATVLSLLAITTSYPTTLRSGAQSVTADRNTRRSNDTDKRKGVR